MKNNIISWIAQLIVVFILGQTLFFKFTDAPEVAEMFAKLGMGPFGYKLIGSLELVACILLLIPSSTIWGAILSWGLMSGAIMGHISKIGFEGNAGAMAGMAIAAWLLSCLIIFFRRNQASFIANMFGTKSSNEMQS
ncbi:DoxX family protein [Puniceicoccaceae bacterium K14]|nr:DoxX family protein [Puniceicoccaceae bacterium K14]